MSPEILALIALAQEILDVGVDVYNDIEEKDSAAIAANLAAAKANADQIFSNLTAKVQADRDAATLAAIDANTAKVTPPAQ